jgi:hypothetical protein
MAADNNDTLLPFALPSIRQKNVTAAFDGGRISSDGGVLLLAGADRRLGLIGTLATLIPEHRDPAQITHTIAEALLPARVGFGGSDVAASDPKHLGAPRPRRLTLPERHSVHGAASPPNGEISIIAPGVGRQLHCR